MSLSVTKAAEAVPGRACVKAGASRAQYAKRTLSRSILLACKEQGKK